MAVGLIRLDQTTCVAVASGRLVHLATINPDGTPQVTCIYVGWEGDQIVAGHLADHIKLQNIRRDPRVTGSVESDVPFEGFSPYVVIKGIARVEEGGAVAVLRRITNGQFRRLETTGPRDASRTYHRNVVGVGPWGWPNKRGTGQIRRARGYPAVPLGARAQPDGPIASDIRRHLAVAVVAVGAEIPAKRRPRKV